MASSDLETLKVPCLGRPFKLGMLYDCRNDNLIFGDIYFWDKATVKKNTLKTNPGGKTASAGDPGIIVIEEDTLQEKTKHLGITGGLKLSVLPDSRLVKNISGSAAYLNDRMSSNNQARVCLKYTGPSELRSLDMTKMASQASKSSVEATHVVTGVYDGADAFLVFDRHDCDKDKYISIKQKLLNAVNTLAKNPHLRIEAMVPDKTEAEKYECTLYADSHVQGQKRFSSFKKAIEFYRGLPQLLRGKPVPIAVQLYPLSKLTSKSTEVKLVRQVSDSVATQAQEIFEALHVSKITCNEIQQNSRVCEMFSRLQHQLSDFEGKMTLFHAKAIKDVASLLPQIRSGKVNEDELYKDISQSPFAPQCLSSFVAQKVEEVKKLYSLMRQMEDIIDKFIPAGEKFKSAVEDFNCVVVCFAFNVITEQDPILTNMNRYLKGQAPEPVPQKQSWHKDPAISKRMRQQIKHFVKLAKANNDPNKKFLVTDHAKEELQAGAILISGDNGLEEFEPPSEPGQPFAKDISHECITLSWTPPETGIEHIECYNVYCSLSSPTLQWTRYTTRSTETSKKVTGLLSSTSYIFKVQAKCKCKLFSLESENSDPITTSRVRSSSLKSEVSQDSEMVESELPPYSEATRSDAQFPPTATGKQDISVQTTKPQTSALSHDQVRLEWQLKVYDSEDEVQYYIVSFRSLADSQTQWTQTETDRTFTVVKGLDSFTKYVFKVKPICKLGIGIDSDVSDPVMTKSASCRPGKPQATSISSNSIQLEWEEPQHSRVGYYILTYRSTSDTDTSEWDKLVTEDAQPKATVRQLKPSSSYRFKVRPMFFAEGIDGIESILSDPIKTTETLCKTGRPWASESSTTHNSVVLSWSKPEYELDEVDFYNVYYSSYQDVQSDPKRRWQKKTTQGLQNQESLTIDGLTPNTQYIFKVRPELLSDVRGEDSDESAPIKTKTVCQTGKPKPNKVSHNSIELEWDIPKYGSDDINSYVVSYTLEKSTPIEKWETCETYTSEPKCSISGLHPNSKYIFQVLPKCTEKVSVPSESSEVIWTKSPVCKPGTPQAIFVTHNSVRLIWEKPEYESDKVDFYTVLYGIQNNEQSWMCRNKPTANNETSMTIKKLKPNEVYLFRVRPECRGKVRGVESNFSDPITTKSQAYRPGKPNVNAVTHNSVTIQWDQPEYDEQNYSDTYTVLYCEENNNTVENWKKKSVEDGVTSTTISCLSPNTQYIFKLLLMPTDGDSIESDISDPIKTNPLECQPSKPRSSITTEAHGSVCLEWDRPQYCHENIQSYIVSCYVVSDHLTLTLLKQYITEGPREKFTVHELAANKQYVFKVRPICSTSNMAIKVLESEESDPVQINSQDCKPSKPTPLTRTHDSVTLRWDIPGFSGNTIKSYTISYCTADDKENWRAENVECTDCNATIGNLEPNKQYLFRVLPKSESITLNCIESEISESIATDMLQCQPGKPKAYTTQSHNSIRLQWDKPQYGHESIESYIVYYCSKTDTSVAWKKLITEGPMEQITVQELAPNKPYVFKVRPICSTSNMAIKVLESEESDPVQIDSQDCKPSKPTPLTRTHDSITLRWDIPGFSGNIIKSYTISYCTADDKENWRAENVECTDCKAAIDLLVPNKQYLFKVLPKSENIGLKCIESEISEPITTDMLQCQPGKPKAYTTQSHNSIRLQWDKPQYGHESIESYIVYYYSKTDTSVAWKKLITEGPVEQITVQELAPNKPYVFKVRPICSTSNMAIKVLESEESDPVQIDSQDCKPSKPTPLTRTHDSVTLRWDIPGFSGNTIKSYTISYCTADDKEKWRAENVECTDCKAAIGNLEPNKQYLFKVLPKSENIGLNCIESETSEPITTDMLQCRVGKPKAYTTQSHNSIRLQWDKPQYGHESIESYIVYYYSKTDTSVAWKKLITEGPVEQITVQELAPNKPYVFKVRPICSTSNIAIKVLESEESDPVQIDSQDCKPSKPTPLTRTHNSITLQWDIPGFNGSTIQSYTISYCTADDKENWRAENVECTDCKAAIGNLEPNKQYLFKVLPKSESIGLNCIESETSEPITTDMLQCRVGKPKAYTTQSHNSIRLQWKKPQYGHESIESYIVYYCSKTDTSVAWKQLITEGSVEQITVQELAPNKPYVFKVRPICSTSNMAIKVLESEESDPVQINSQDCKPSKPTPLTRTHDSVTLRWDIPGFSGNTIKSYTISYCTADDKENWRAENVECTDCNATIGNLEPNKQYLFKVLPKSESITLNCIESDISESIATDMLQCQPGKPKAFTTQSHNSIHLKWDKPEYGRETIESYIVFYHEVGDYSTPGNREENKLFTNGLEEHVTITGLAVNNHFIFKVSPYCSHSALNSKFRFLDSEESDPIQINSQPSKPEITHITNNSVQLKWKMLGSKQDVEFYTVSFRLASDLPDKSKWRKQSTNTAQTDFTVNELNPATSYIFRISATDKTGNTSDGEDSDPIQTTSTSKPGKPTASKVTDATIVVTWTHPEVGMDCINSYDILYCRATVPGSSKHQQTWKTRPTNKTNEIELTPLQYNTKYLVKIRPNCKPGTIGCESDVSDPIETNSTSEPLEVIATNVTASSVELKWNKPVRGQESIVSYDVYYQEATSKEDWKKINAGTALNVRISGLQSLKEYMFKVFPVCDVGTGTESAIVNVTTQQLVCKTGEITFVKKKHNKIELKWDRPKHGVPKSYLCSYRCEQEKQWKPAEQNPTTEQIEISGLIPNTTYIFKVCPQFEHVGDMVTKETVSELVDTDVTPVAERLIKKCEMLVLPKSACTIYKIPTKKVWEGKKLGRIARYELDLDPGQTPQYYHGTEKVLMLVGATGAGKSTLINGIVNYIFKVQFEDKFRFKLICDESDKDQTHSQTSSVNAYTIYPLAGSCLDYTLTIIDTPGFGDTRGVEQDEELIGQIKDFFTHTTPDHKGIDQIHGVGLVVKNPEMRLTTTQKYISSCILSIFGKDIKENIFLMVTFADGAAAPVLEAVKAAEFPYKEYFKFNNSALYPEIEIESGDSTDDSSVALPMWNMGKKSFEKFFKAFEKYKPQSLTLTRQVLEERERLESYVRTLREEITRGVQEIDKLEQFKDKLKAKEQNVDAFKDFKFTANVTKQRKVDLPRGQYVTNCLTCNRTCHKNCAIDNDERKYMCCVMTGDQTDAYCTVCKEGKCHWTKHVNNPYRFEVYTELVEQTIDDLKKYHDEAESGKLDVENMIKDLEDHLDQVHFHVMSLVNNARKSLEKLGEIALKPNPPTNEGYIDLLIEEERREGRTGFEKRISTFVQLKKRAKVLRDNVMSDTPALDTQVANSSDVDKPKKKRWYHFIFQWGSKLI